METAPDRRNRFEIVYDPAEGTAFVYLSRWAGVCGPISEKVAVDGRAGAEAEALRFGLLRSGEWRRAANGFEYAEAEQATVTAGLPLILTVVLEKLGMHGRRSA